LSCVFRATKGKATPWVGDVPMLKQRPLILEVANVGRNDRTWGGKRLGLAFPAPLRLEDGMKLAATLATLALAIAKPANGSCPWGWTALGSYCLRSGDSRR
jgi:hypothetical protein